MAFPAALPSYTTADPNKTLDEDNHTQRHNSMQDDIINIATKVGIDASADTDSHDYRIDQLENNNNQFVYDEAVTGTLNGVNLIFTTQDSYVGGSLEVFINGLKQTRNLHYTETTPAVGTFTLDTAPQSDDIIRASYMHTTTTGTTDSDTVDGYHAAGILAAAEATATAAIDAAVVAVKEALYPVGSLYMNKTVSTNPATLLGFGTWAAIEDKMIMAVGSTYPVSTSGGAATHSHTLGDSGWAQVVLGSGGVIGMRRISVGTTYNETHRHTATSGSATNGVASAAALDGATDSESSLPPYETAYIWERTA